MRHCVICGHETAGRRKIYPEVCGPCLLGKPKDFWKGFEQDMERLGARPQKREQ